ncbi:DNA-directed RNA polymerase subunit alpha [Candidatus Dojkabacteria bacterium]|nr:DNA-directed RNA polymerase subunit alpha [Candidatus Dojkabacteria bacterium]
MIDFKDLNVEELENDGKKGVYKIGPLPRGYGNTVANSLRRVLLSSLPGAAVTSIRVAGIEHEYSTVEGVKENVVEIMMNLKGIRFSCKSDEPQIVRLTKKGEGEIIAGDLDLTESVEVMDKNAKIATITDKGSAVEMELVVERGVGYRLADEDVRSEAGRLPMDASFSPVERVMYNIEETRKGEKMNLDQATMTVFTDGSIDSREAVAYASQVLRDAFSQVFLLSGGESAPSSSKEQKPAKEGEDVGEMLVEDLDISTRSKSSLVDAGYKQVKDLVGKTPEDLLDISGFGAKGLDELKAYLKKLGVELG